MPKFSVIMPSFLGKYKNSGANNNKKIVRAIQSVLDQSFQDFELIVIADGCDETVEIVKENFPKEEKIRMFRVSDDRNFGARRNAGASGFPRNAGLQQAEGEYAIYLDVDDSYDKEYLESLSKLMTNHDWYWFHDLSWDKKTGQFNRHLADIGIQGRCGTSNICHRVDLFAWWSDRAHYLHDWMFICTLKAISHNYEFLDVAGYQVCHVPHLLDV